MSDAIVQEEPKSRPLTDSSRLLSKYGFYFSLCVFFYVVLFPFAIDISRQQMSAAWSQAIGIPYWCPKTGLRILADDAANILLTIPLGFFGYLYFSRTGRKTAIWKWWALGFALGSISEFMQLAIPTRATVITDTINNSIGTALGAAAASFIGNRMLSFFTGAALERRNIYLWLLIWSLVALVGPYDLSSDALLSMDSEAWTFRPHAWEPAVPSGDKWLRMAGFLVIGALAARLAVPGRRKYSLRQPLAAAALVLALPAAIQCMRLFLTLHDPTLNDLALDIFGALAGYIAAFSVPAIVRTLNGFFLFNAALIAAGLSPCHFHLWRDATTFQWMLFYEFCASRMPSAFYEAILSLFGFAILGGFLQLSFPRLRCRHAAVYALALSGAIEFAQTFLPGRMAGTTDILMGVIGAWTGAYICTTVENSRKSDVRLSFTHLW